MFADVVRRLRRRGIGLHAAEDAAQEAGTRAFDRGVPFDDAADLRRWVFVVARRIAIDDARSAARAERLATVRPMPMVSPDVPQEAEGRMRWEATRRAFHQLSPGEQQAIRDDGQPADRKEAVRLAVRRHRARSHLLRLVEGVAALIPVIWRRGQRTAAVVAVASAPIFAWTVVHRPLPAEPPAAGAYGNAPRIEDARLVDAVFDATASAATDTGGAAASTAAAPVAPVSASVAASPQSRTVDADLARPSPTGGEDHTHVVAEEKTPGEPIACAWAPGTGQVCGPAVSIDFPL